MRIYVLSVGINDYGSQIAIPNLCCAVNDAAEVYRVLRTSYNADGKLLCTNELPTSAQDVPQGHGTRTEILQAINAARRYLDPEDLFVFFFSGHGIPDTPGYILPDSAEFGRPGTYLMYRELFGTLATLPCMHIICFLNCCYAGVAAAPAALPGLVVSKKHAVLYAATDDKTVTPDRLPGSSSGHSPFGQALVEYLKRETEVGASFSPEALAAYLKSHAETTLVLDGRTVRVRPVFVSPLSAVGLGDCSFQVRRPGFGLEVGAMHHCATGETLHVPVGVRDAGTGEIRWTAESRLTGFRPARKEFHDGALELVFQYPGEFDIEITAENTDTKERTSRTVTVRIHPGESPDPGLDEQPLALCARGVEYSAELSILGGTAPFEVTLEGLPEGLHYELDDLQTIRIHGLVPSAGGGGTPLSRDNGPVVQMINIHVKDGAGRDFHARRRFVVYHPQDYCRVEKSDEYCIGCLEDATTIQAVCDVIQLNMKRNAEATGLNVRALQAALNRAAMGAGHQVFQGIIAGDPHARVQIQSYLIKKYPVTLHDWKRFIDETKSAHIPQSRWPPTAEDLKKPVTDITYEALCAYLKWKGTRLPTGREWQVAADGGKGLLFPWGNEFDYANCNMCNDSECMDLTPVDAFDRKYPSPTGTRDMVGNACEWVDRRVHWPQRKAFAQVFRGGSFRHAPLCGIISRDSDVVGVLFGADANAAQIGQTAFDWLGFRDVIDLDPTLESGQSLVAIPAGEIQTDGGEKKYVPQFHMARYAVSNLEYWEFVRATGHRRPEGWDLHDDTLPFPHDQRHLPVVNVSYLDAHAFCLWKSRVKGGIYRLPTPEQWLAALQGGEYRRFPWEGDFNLQFCNEITSGWGKRVPVFDLPEGRSRHGVYNLVGNVCEWVGPLEVRGGSWLTDCRRLAEHRFQQCVQNDGRALDFRRPDVGFRYVVLEVPSDRDGTAGEAEKERPW